MTVSAVSRAFRLVYLPFSSVVPMMLETVCENLASSSSLEPSSTRTTTVTGFDWLAIACNVIVRLVLRKAIYLNWLRSGTTADSDIIIRHAKSKQHLSGKWFYAWTICPYYLKIFSNIYLSSVTCDSGHKNTNSTVVFAVS